MHTNEPPRKIEFKLNRLERSGWYFAAIPSMPGEFTFTPDRQRSIDQLCINASESISDPRRLFAIAMPQTVH